MARYDRTITLPNPEMYGEDWKQWAYDTSRQIERTFESLKSTADLEPPAKTGLPTPEAEWYGRHFVCKMPGQEDHVYVCIQDGTGAFQWVQVYPHPAQPAPPSGGEQGLLLAIPASASLTATHNGVVQFDTQDQIGGFWSYSGGRFTALKPCIFEARALIATTGVDEDASWSWHTSLAGQGGAIGWASKTPEDIGQPMAYWFGNFQIGDWVELRTRRDDKDFEIRRDPNGAANWGSGSASYISIEAYGEAP